jgi:hypothetical protein
MATLVLDGFVVRKRQIEPRDSNRNAILSLREERVLRHYFYFPQKRPCARSMSSAPDLSGGSSDTTIARRAAGSLPKRAPTRLVQVRRSMDSIARLADSEALITF